MTDDLSKSSVGQSSAQDESRRADERHAVFRAFVFPGARWAASGAAAWILLKPGSRPRRAMSRALRSFARAIVDSQAMSLVVRTALRPFPGIKERLVQRLILAPPASLPPVQEIEPHLRGETKEVRLAYARLLAQRGVAAAPAARDAKPRLAYFSPVPDQETGIANYSADLLPHLGEHYDIVVIAPDAARKFETPQGAQDVHDFEWFTKNSAGFDRVLYHMGNSPFHIYMIGSLEKYPGIVVLHDFFLNHLLRYMEDVLFVRSAWMQRLYDAHGYGAVATRHRDGVDAVTHLYPASFFLFANATGVIVHNAECRDLARRYFGDVWADRIREIAQLRSIPPRDERAAARARLGLGDRFVLCSFGFVVEPKRIVELIKAWNAAALGAARPCMLALVGGLPDGPYAQEVRRLIAASPDGSPVVVTGFASPQVYEDYLAAADVAVQLRAHSRGESSRAAVDCMAAGLPTIVNAHGSLAEFPDDCVVKIPDRFTVDELTQAIVALASDAERRAGLSARAVAHIRAVADPTAVARRYRDAIEAFAADAPPARDLSVLRKTAAALEARDASKAEWVAEARGLALASPAPSPARRLYVDISELARHDLRTGIQRVARGQLTSLLDAPPAGFRVEPVYLEAQGGQWTLRYAADATLRLLGLPSGALIEDVVDARPGDVYFMPDYSPVRVADAAEAGLYRALRDKGVHIAFSVYDNLPIRHPRFFPDYAAAEHARWLKAAGESADTLICISETVAADTNDWLGANLAAGTPLPECRAIHLGADLSGSAPTTGLPPDGEDTLGRLRARPTFLMVGTIEPRKGYAQALAAFETLWRDKMEVNLVIVGREGWSGLPASQRRTIPDIVRALEESRFAGDRLFWFRDVSDEYLARIYEVASCLLAASEAEGFGLPLIEAAQHGLPLLVRDIPVFHEVAGCHATYFSGEEPQDLAQAIERWLALKAADAEVRADAMEWITWKENARRLVDVLIK